MKRDDHERIAQVLVDGAIATAGRLNLPQLTVAAILRDTDWSAVLKTHAILEAASAEALRRQLGQSGLLSLAASAPFTTRARVLAEVTAASDSHMRFVSRLTSLRNLLVHDCRHFEFTFAKHLATLNRQDRVAMVNDLALTSETTPAHHTFPSYPSVFLVSSTVATISLWLDAPRYHRRPHRRRSSPLVKLLD